MNRLRPWEESLAIHEFTSEKVVCDPVPFWPIEVYVEVGQRVLESELLFEILIALIQGLYLVDAL